jgi:hypothetical protein
MKFDASSRHSEGYFLEVKPIKSQMAQSEFVGHNEPINTGIPLEKQRSISSCEEDEAYLPNQTETFQETNVGSDQLS